MTIQEYETYHGITKIQALEGDAIIADDWHHGISEALADDDGWSDSSFPGCQFRIPMFHGKYKIAINIKITGRNVYYSGSTQKIRCQIEYVGDCEPSTFGNGWLYLNAERYLHLNITK